MQATVYDRYGPPEVLELAEVDKPVATGDRILIKLRAASLNRSDWEALTGTPLYARMGGLRAPGTPILGSDIAGTVEAVGEDVTRFKPGDDVFGDVLYFGSRGFAEYVAVREKATLTIKPPTLSFEEAAALPQAGVIALQAFRGRGKVSKGQDVLINGAGGGGGSFAIQIAKAQGARVTGVDTAEKFDFMRSVGADRTIDYRTEDFTKSGRYDVILDLVAHRSLFAIRRALKQGGRYLLVGGSMWRLFQTAVVGWPLSKLGSRYSGVLGVKPNREDLEHLADLVVKDGLKVHIDRTYTLDQVPAALDDLGAGRSRGKLVITI